MPLPTVGGSNDTWGTEMNAWAMTEHNSDGTHQADKSVQKVEVASGGTLVGTRKRINLIQGANTTLTVADDAGNNRVNVTIAASGGGGGAASMPNTKIVSASGSGITGDYNCDGTSDNVEIQAAIDAVKTAGGGTVLLTKGTFNLAAPLNIDGDDDVNVEREIYLRGQGPHNTTLVCASGIASGIQLRKCVRAHIWDLGLTVTGATDGIMSTRSTGVNGGQRSAWFSSIERVQIIGPWDGTHTGWGMDLGNFFRSTIRNVEMGGVGNGLRFLNEEATFNAGDCNVTRVFVDLAGNNATAYACESTAGAMNQISFDTCHAIARPADTATVCWKFSGAGNTSHIRTRNCNAEQFVTTVSVASTASDIDVDLVHVTLKTGSTLVAAAGYNSRFRCGLAYVVPSATASLITDTNGYFKGNVYGPIDVYCDANATINAPSLGTHGVMRDVVADAGTGAVIPASTRRWPAVYAPRIVDLTYGATVSTDVSRGNHFRLLMTGNATLAAPSNPTDGQRCVWEVTASGGARTLSLTTGSAGAFAFGATITALSATTSGLTDILEAVYNAGAARWRVVAYNKGF